MNTEITDAKGREGRDWVCYDAGCRFCVRLLGWCRAWLVRKGFIPVPLQARSVRERLHVSEEELMREMRVITADGVVLGGADAVLYLAKAAGWARPLVIAAQAPGMMRLLRRVYAWIAVHRRCDRGSCSRKSTDERDPTPITAPRQPRSVQNRLRRGVDWVPLIVLTAVACGFGRRMPAWGYMWAIALAMYAGCKWLTFRTAPAELRRRSRMRAAAYLFAWPGMDAAAFLDGNRRADPPGRTEWLHGAACVAIGALLVYLAGGSILPLGPLAIGWVGMIGLVLMLHFGMFRLLSVLWRSVGVEARPIMRAPLRAESLREFWGARWNTGFHELADRYLFRRVHRRLGVGAATLLVFFVSGIIHDLVISVPARGGIGLPTLYFVLQGFGVLIERTAMGRRLGLGRGWRGRLFALLITAGPVFWLFHPTFVREVIIPFIRAIGSI